MVRILRIFVVMMLFVVALATPAAAARERPIKAKVVGEHGIAMFDPTCQPEEGDVWWRFSSDGAGQVSHLGRVEYSLTQCTVPGPAGYSSEGTIEFTAANGDKLYIEHTMLSQGEPPEGPLLGFVMEGVWTAVGGTGRFASASGSGTLAGLGDIPDGVPTLGLPDGLMKLRFRGEISYDPSDRSEK